MRRLLKATLVLAIAILPLALSNTQVRASLCGYFLDILDFAPITGGVGLDYDDTSDTLIASVNSPLGLLGNFRAYDPDTAVSSGYSGTALMTGQIKLTTIRTSSCQAGFVAGDVYAGSGVTGQIVKIGAGGSPVQSSWVVLPGELSPVTGLYQDRHCSLGGDLFVVTSGLLGGNVWRVTSAGQATLLATLPKHLEGIAVVPNNTARYGPLAGRVVVGDEDHVTPLLNGPNGKLFAIDGTGNVITVGSGADTPAYPNYPVVNLTDPSPSSRRFNPQDIDVVPMPRPGIPGDAMFYGIDAGDGRILKADIADGLHNLNGCGECGPLLLTQEIPADFLELPSTGLFVLKWGGTQFELEVVEIDFDDDFVIPTRWQDVTFRGGQDCRTCTGVIGNFVWKDLDGDGIQDASEPGIEGVKVTLTQPSTPGYSQTTLTDEDGKYQFTGLCLGTYVVTVTLPSGDTVTITGAGGDTALDSNANGSSVTLTTDSSSDQTIDFGLKGPGRIGNFVWHDLNADGVQDSGEPGIAGVTVHLKAGVNNTSGPDLLTAITDGSGLYQFINMNPGSFTVVVDPPAGYTASPTLVGAPATDSNPNPSNVTLTSAAPIDQTIDFGYFLPPTYGHIIVNKVTVPSTDTTTQFTFTTTGTGYSSFTLTGGGSHNSGNLEPGVYSVAEQLPAGWTLTSATCTNGETPASINLQGDETVICTFTNTKKAALGNFVWLDTDADGQQDSGEPGVSNVTVQLFQGVTLVGTTLTDTNGLYLFGNLDPATYTVKFTLPSGYTFTSQNVGADASDSDADTTTGITGTYTLAAGEVNLTVDAGLKAIVQPPPTCVPTTFSFASSSNSSTTGTAGNIRTFTSGTMSVKASAWSRTDSGGTWNTAYLGQYTHGLGVTDGSESGSNDTHTVDNGGGRDNYILFEFSTSVIVDQAFLDYVGADSDVNVWVGTKVDPYNNHQTLNDAFLTTLTGETSDTSSGDARWADFNGGSLLGNVVVIAAKTSETDDSFKLSKLEIECTPPPPPPACTPTTFAFTGSTSTTGSAGNIRTFNAGTLAVKTSAWSRKDSDGTWNTAYLGAYANGLGVTDGSESGSSDTHTVDNMGGRDNYILFEFNTPVIVDQAFLDYVGADSDVSVWVGTKTDPYNNHLTLSDTLLGSLSTEANETDSADARWANFNGANIMGNVVIIAAMASDDSPEDSFKLSKLEIDCTPPPPPSCVAATFTFSGSSSTTGTAGNIRTFSVSGTSVHASAFSRTDSGGTWNTAYLGLYSPGLGVTDGSESGSYHKVDNNGSRDNYVLFEFSQPVIIDKAFLTYIGEDSDLQAWVGTKTDPYNTHQTLTDSFLSSLLGESNSDSGTADERWADLNNGAVMGNVLVIAAKTTETNDEFKINKLTVSCVPPPPPQSCTATNFSFGGSNSSTSGSAGNTRTFTSGTTSVKTNAFSRTDSGTWNTAYLGQYSPGLGVTDGSEGTGSGNTHVVDNEGRDNYVLFRFSTPVKVDRAFLDYIGDDGDASVWVGTVSNAYSSTVTLSDSLLSSLASETNTSSATDSRWADINSAGLVGNVVVIATKVGDTNDSFKLSKLDTCK